MATCDVCGNDYHQAFTVTQADRTTSTLDSFECAIHQVAPRCALWLHDSRSTVKRLAVRSTAAPTAPGTPPARPDGRPAACIPH
jgi:hypothetical protein